MQHALGVVRWAFLDAVKAKIRITVWFTTEFLRQSDPYSCSRLPFVGKVHQDLSCLLPHLLLRLSRNALVPRGHGSHARDGIRRSSVPRGRFRDCSVLAISDGIFLGSDRLGSRGVERSSNLDAWEKTVRTSLDVVQRISSRSTWIGRDSETSLFHVFSSQRHLEIRAWQNDPDSPRTVRSRSAALRIRPETSNHSQGKDPSFSRERYEIFA